MFLRIYKQRVILFNTNLIELILSLSDRNFNWTVESSKALIWFFFKKADYV